MQTPEEIARKIVDRFSWGSNVIHEGRMVGQQHVVAIAIADAIKMERRRANIARDALADTAMALAGVTSGYLKPKGKIAPRALAGANIALRLVQ